MTYEEIYALEWQKLCRKEGHMKRLPNSDGEAAIFGAAGGRGDMPVILSSQARRVLRFVLKHDVTVGDLRSVFKMGGTAADDMIRNLRRRGFIEPVASMCMDGARRISCYRITAAGVDFLEEENA